MPVFLDVAQSNNLSSEDNNYQQFFLYETKDKKVGENFDDDVYLQFSVLSTSKELVLSLNHPRSISNLSTRGNGQGTNTHLRELSYELVVGGGDEHDISWLTLLDAKKRLKTRLQSKNTPHILSHEEMRTFWLRLRKHNEINSQNPRELLKDNFIYKDVLCSY